MKAASFVQTSETKTIIPFALVAMLYRASSGRIRVNMVIILLHGMLGLNSE
jgi:hypothetical protein